MDRVPSQPYPGSDFTPSLTFVTSLQTSRLYTSPDAVQFAWYRAFPNPSYNKASGVSEEGHGEGEYTREYQPGVYWCLLSDAPGVLKRYMPNGEWETGTVAIGFDPAVSALSEYDWIVPMSQDGLFPSSTAPATSTPLLPADPVAARTFVQKETLVRGARREEGAGTISTSGSAVTGIGTAFLSFLTEGDVLVVGKFAARVVSLASDTHLTLDAAPPAAFIGRGYQRGRECPTYPPVARVESIRGRRVYEPGTDFIAVSPFPLALTGDYIQWLATDSPAPGERYGITYDYIARYEMTDMGDHPPVVQGKSLLITTVANLWKPQQNDI